MARRAEPVHLRPDGSIGTTTGRATTLLELALLARKPAWHADALCADPAYAGINWFPAPGDDVAALKRVCAGCLVRSECATAGSREAHGIWSGLSAKQRRRGSTVRTRRRRRLTKPRTVQKCRMPHR